MILGGAILASSISPVRAEDVASAGNLLLATQLADAITTSAALRSPINSEHDPLARPFTHNEATTIGLFVVQNVLQRIIFRKHPAILRYFAIGEGYAVGSNVRILNHTHEYYQMLDAEQKR